MARQGNNDAPWILEVLYPSHLYPVMDDRVDARTGGTAKEITQCWGSFCILDGKEMRCLRQSYLRLADAMRAAKRVAKLRDVVKVDVYDRGQMDTVQDITVHSSISGQPNPE